MAKSRDPLIPTRHSLLRRLQDLENSSGWQEFFDTYWRLVYGVARKAGLTDSEAQDVVQETMIAAAKHLPTFRYDPAIGSFKAWLLNMTRWRIKDQVRKRSPFVRRTSRPDQTTGSTATVDRIADPANPISQEVWDKEWKQALLSAAIDNVKRRLDPQKYQIFDFYVNKEWPPGKVAAAFGISVDQVYLAKHRITAMLAEEVKRLGKEIT
jgi:RNA polymerase sigma-70 factor (ECF subfamily)